jgi:cell division protein FtsI/penicillin-binding protein 2
LATSIRLNEKSPAFIQGLSVAGKTGTSRRHEASGYSADLYTSFMGYFPAEKPELLVVVVIDTPRRAEAWGSTVAAPIFRRIALESLHYLGKGAGLPSMSPDASLATMTH